MNDKLPVGEHPADEGRPDNSSAPNYTGKQPEWKAEKPNSPYAVEQMLSLLWRNGNGQAYGYICTIDPDGKVVKPHKATPQTAYNQAQKHAGKADIYFGVNPIHPQWKGGKPGGKDVAAIACVFADFDCGEGKPYPDKAAAKAHIDSLPLAPSMLVDSGGGYHAYWYLAEPVLPDGKAASLQRRWVELVGGDKAAKDTARMLRLPGFANLKYEDKPIATIIEFHPDRLYTLEQLADLLPPEIAETATPAEVGSAWVEWAIKRVEQGEGRNDVGFKLACQLRDSRKFNKGEMSALMREYALAVKDRGEHPYLIKEAENSLKQAYSAAPREPASIDGKPDHAQIADILIAENPDLAYGREEWKFYEAGIWTPRHRDNVKRIVLDKLESMRPDGIRATEGTVSGVQELWRVKVALSENEAGQIWNAKPNLIVLNNCTLNLDTLETREHRREDYITVKISLDYDPDAKAPTWERVLSHLPPEVQEYLQMFFGIALTTELHWEVVLWLYGEPGSGKSTFLYGIQAAFGGFGPGGRAAKEARWGLLSVADVSSRFGLGHIEGKTLLFSTEQRSSYIDSDVLNGIVSGDSTRIERKYQDPIEIVPMAKVVFASNELPRAKAQGGWWRRVKVVTFPPLSEAERDPSIRGKLLQEAPGIFNWCLEGLRKARALPDQKLPAPDSVQATTDEALYDSDPVARFLSEQAEPTGEGWSYNRQQQRQPISMVYAHYKLWSERNNLKPLSAVQFGRSLSRFEDKYPCYEPKGPGKGGREADGWHVPGGVEFER